ncbi:type III secretion low calcium response chaperone LcrH/SycD [Candidatus Rubidus massiliensis]|nr:MAG: type III secretion chaperone [Chlamydia sp. 32-24]CDZ80062.1 type III secretion low calcium response chaperone LcrH/SycD [Candidatus Rubidus massiliensis]
MSELDWLKTLDWGQDQLQDLRFTGFAYLRQGKYDIAIKIFEVLNVLNQNAYDAQTLGALYLQTNHPDKALKYLEIAIKLEENHSPTLMNLAKAFFMIGKSEEALRICQILKNDKNSVVANLAKAHILAYS